jgi:hypothetical protein
MPNRKYQNLEIYEYKTQMKSILATTRFNTATFQENRDFIVRGLANKTLPPKLQCLYNCSEPIASTVPIYTKLFVLEMNNETNQIMGIGLIKNQSPEYNKYPIHSAGKYNQFAYHGVYRIDRSDFSPEELDIVKVLETMCFRGRRHQKRLQGIKAFPYDMLFDYKVSTECDIVVFVADMFKNRFLRKTTD